MLGELDSQKMKALLASQSLGRLACCKDRKPYIIPVTYAFDGDFIYGQSNEGMKLNMMRKNPHVCFEVDQMLNMRNWQSVIAYGTFEELTGADADAAREMLFGHVYTLATSSTVHLHEHGGTANIDDSTRVKHVMYRIKIESMTGRFEQQ
jgi:nitroimidazol reductase NimA-like FMN-containing flavoprotein (pyridoxamine 5'-phosphate oxidase superfamily)